ncbi:hypothetical protein Pmani_016542 [Petrolisthes manimaculis]|uniref:Uncharacterized protein n=1 Tax=Petrolisthes manimaculis TaxID=1843537 RepID=A0AAE1U699_9EUCA|nr:hypothetical protein Pmani_016542 [Petrolisthes manimaculis]
MAWSLSPSAPHCFDHHPPSTHEVHEMTHATQPIATTQTFNHFLSSQFLLTRSLRYHHVTAVAPVLSSSVTHDSQATTSNHLPFAGLAHALVSLLLTTFGDATSVLILHDGTAAAREVLTHVLQERDVLLLVTQIRDLSLLMVEEDGTPEGRDTPQHFDLTLVIFVDHFLVSRFLVTNKSLGWVSRPLLLFSVSDDAAAREVLDVSLWMRRVTLLQPQELRLGVKGEGGLKFQMSTLLPHTPPPHNIISRLVTPGDPRLKQHHIFPDTHSDFHGHLFHIASWIDDFPYLFYDSEKRVVGIGEAMLSEISHRRNFTYHLQDLPPDEYWGELINNTWVGMLGQVVRGEKDFVINGMALVRDRYLATDFTLPYFSDSYSITLQIPPPSPLWLSVVYPFGVWVWASLGVCLVLLSLAFHALVKPDPIRIYNTGADVISTLVWLSKTLLRQSSPSVPSAPGCRAFLSLWYLAALVLSTSYMGNLIAFLTVPAQTKRIDTLQELARTDLRLHMLDYGNFVPGYLWSSREPVLRQLGGQLSLLPDYDEVMAAFDDGAGVLEASEYSHFLFITRQRQKKSYRVEEKLYPNYVGWVFRKGSTYTYLFNR